MNSVIQDFEPGTHSFYGAMNIEILNGTVYLNGATLTPGFMSNIFAPPNNLPISFESSEPFTMRISEIDITMLSKFETNIYDIKRTPDGFTKLGNYIYYSSMMRGAEYPQSLIKFVDNIILKKPTKIFLCGGKGVGKSTFSKVLTNKIISLHGKVGFLDLDPGQPEISLPGSISFSILTSFLLGPAERHSRLAQVSYYYGGVSLSDNIKHYFDCLEQLIKEIPPDIFVVINSFGWVKDLGLELHKRILNLILPENLIMLTSPNEQVTPPRGYAFTAEITPRASIFKTSPVRQRELRFISYFESWDKTLSQQVPIALNLRTIHLRLINVKIDPTEILMAFNGSIVALFNDTRKFPPNKKLVTILRKITPMPIIGYGFVKAIDKAQGIMYVVTDVPPDAINTVVLGAIQTPTYLYHGSKRIESNYMGTNVYNKEGAGTDPMHLKNPVAYQ